MAADSAGRRRFVRRKRSSSSLLACPCDEVPAALVDQRAVVVADADRAGHVAGAYVGLLPVLRRGPVIRVHHNTAIYMSGNEVERRLGIIIEVYS